MVAGIQRIALEAGVTFGKLASRRLRTRPCHADSPATCGDQVF